MFDWSSPVVVIKPTANVFFDITTILFIYFYAFFSWAQSNRGYRWTGRVYGRCSWNDIAFMKAWLSMLK